MTVLRVVPDAISDGATPLVDAADGLADAADGLADAADGAVRWISDHWSRMSRCRGMDVNIFFTSAPDEIEAAKVICNSCPVRFPCLDEAVRNPGLRGVWGGLSDDERQSRRRSS